MVHNFTDFAPLGIVIVAMLGIGIAESSGLIGAIIRLLVISSPERLMTFVIVFAGVLSNTASDIGYVLLIPLAGTIFLSLGRNPLVGMAAAFAGVSGGFSANLILGTIDPLLAGLSQEAAQIIDPAYEVNPTANYYFMVVSTFLIAFAGTYVTEKIVAPRLGEYKGSEKPEEIKKLDKAEKMARSAVDLDPYNQNNLDTYAWVLYKLNKFDEALEWIKKAYDNGGESSGVVVEHYGDILYKLNRKEEALEFWKQALTKDDYSDLLNKKINDKTLYE